MSISMFTFLTISKLNLEYLKDCMQHYLINNLLCRVNCFIHKCRFLKTTPNFPHFINDLRIIASSLYTLSSNKAITLAIFFNEFSDSYVCSIHLDDATAATGQRRQCAHHTPATGGEEREIEPIFYTNLKKKNSPMV